MAADVVDGQDVRMRQCRNRAGLAIEPLTGLRVGQRGGRDRLDGDLTLQPGIARAIHLAHSPLAKCLDDLYGPSFVPGSM